MMAAMKQRRPSRRKPSKKPTPRPPAPRPQPGPDTLAWHNPDQPTPMRRASNAALMASSGIVEPPSPPQGEAGDQASFKVEVAKAAQHAEMLSRNAIVEALIAELPKERPVGVGHNQPLITSDEVREIELVVVFLNAQPIVPSAPDKAEAAASTSKKIGERLLTYLDAFMLEAAKSGGKELAKRLVQAPYWFALSYALTTLAQSISNWLH